MLYLMREEYRDWQRLIFVDKIQISDSELNQSIYRSVRSNDGATSWQSDKIREISWVGSWVWAGGYRDRYWVSSSWTIFFLQSDQYWVRGSRLQVWIIITFCLRTCFSWKNTSTNFFLGIGFSFPVRIELSSLTNIHFYFYIFMKKNIINNNLLAGIFPS